MPRGAYLRGPLTLLCVLAVLLCLVTAPAALTAVLVTVAVITAPLTVRLRPEPTDGGTVQPLSRLTLGLTRAPPRNLSVS